MLKFIKEINAFLCLIQQFFYTGLQPHWALDFAKFIIYGPGPIGLSTRQSFILMRLHWQIIFTVCLFRRLFVTLPSINPYKYFLMVSSININGQLLQLDRPLVMAIINCTPDSFYHGSRCQTDDALLRTAQTAIEQGAAILDIGAYSTRPDATPVSSEEEWQRLSHALQIIRRKFPQTAISVDTFRADIARQSVQEYNANIINDIAAGELDKNMFATVAELQVPYIMMHMRGTPQTMQQLTAYGNMMQEITDYFQQKVYQLRRLGVKDIIIDPGFGFAKTLEQNYELLRKMRYLQIIDCPILVGLSRKSMIYRLLQCSPQDALNGTTAAHMLALQSGANILRVHDVRPAMEAIRIYQQYIQ